MKYGMARFSIGLGVALLVATFLFILTNATGCNSSAALWIIIEGIVSLIGALILGLSIRGFAAATRDRDSGAQNYYRRAAIFSSLILLQVLLFVGYILFFYATPIPMEGRAVSLDGSVIFHVGRVDLERTAADSFRWAVGIVWLLSAILILGGALLGFFKRWRLVGSTVVPPALLWLVLWTFAWAIVNFSVSGGCGEVRT
jgi:hypothetical protein